MRDQAENTPSVMQLLRRGGQCADEMFSLSVGNSGITPRQFAVLTVVAEKSGISQMDIVNATGVDRSTTSEVVKRLVRRRWLERRRTKDDARAYAVRLTAAGKKVLKIGERASLGVDEKVLASLSSAQRTKFIGALRAIVHGLGSENSSAS